MRIDKTRRKTDRRLDALSDRPVVPGRLALRHQMLVHLRNHLVNPQNALHTGGALHLAIGQFGDVAVKLALR